MQLDYDYSTAMWQEAMIKRQLREDLAAALEPPERGRSEGTNELGKGHPAGSGAASLIIDADSKPKLLAEKTETIQ